MRHIDEILQRVQRPARYAGGEWNSVVKDWDAAEVRVVLAYPDLYDVGVGHYGLALLYDLLNRHGDLVAERVFSPWLDLENALRGSGTPLFSLETKRPLGDFDLWYLTMDSGLAFTNVLTLLDLAGVSLTTQRREAPFPLILVGETGARNLEPLAGVVDAVLLGDPEATLLEVCAAVQASKRAWAAGETRPGRAERQALLRHMATLEGVYVPSLYRTTYDEANGTLARVEPVDSEVPPALHGRTLLPLPPLTTRPVVPFLSPVRDRAWVEVGREPARACRQCREGPLSSSPRMRTADELVAGVEALVRHTGYTEVGLLVPASDGEGLTDLLQHLRSRLRGHIRLTLPDLPAEAVTEELVAALGDRGRGGLTVAVGAASERLREALGRPRSHRDLLDALATAFRAGYEHLVLVYTVGVPGEMPDDLQEVVELARQGLQVGRQHRGPRIRISVEANVFLPRAHTAQQRAPLVTAGEFAAKLELLRQGVRGKHLKFSHRGYEEALLEAILARGDRRLEAVILRAWQLGARFDARPEQFRWPVWQQAFQENGVDPLWYVYRARADDEVLPWDHLHRGVGARDRGPQPDPCQTCGVPHDTGNLSESVQASERATATGRRPEIALPPEL